MKNQKGISTLVGIIIIVVVGIVTFGGVFAYQYFVTPKVNDQSQNQNTNPTNPPLTADKILNSNGFVNGNKQTGSQSGLTISNIVLGNLDSDSSLEALAVQTNCSASCGNAVYAFKLVGNNVLMVLLPDSGISGAAQQVNSIKIVNGVAVITETDWDGTRTTNYQVELVDGVFKAEKIVSTQPSITVTSPNGGETLEIGKTYTIKWNSTGIGNVSITMVNKPISTYLEKIATNIENTGSYSWTVPVGNIGLDYPGDKGYIIRVTSAVYPYTFGQVDNISITEPVGYITPDIKVTSPNGGEQFNKGQDIVVKWTSQGISKVSIRATYYDSNDKAVIADGSGEINVINGGECRITYEPISASSGSFTIVGGNTGRCGILPSSNRIRILITGTTLNGNSISDISDNYFSIFPFI
ncbi:MAG: hypothetical protein A2998_01345 [Candidatus Staskawiczbacteria bacterium RIFCSPLOWO2_01_FULL_37_25b]|uniref:Yeast cell wall synthesis Kre9/Knh1-like N-terminal domain-containing protein n=2 Tax=Candidatus Staskawicziibacteriota TaxID=1817916 RepID=A0A1G2HQC0_9BACT|nr:MAG: hypothetical protein A2812_02600 [Candidatus Staskawiczbacteria bacterium RIFCSPHIGHO2_01_FULL_36_16]OGZ74042.1 MAG: hypothetical protein A2998_01345 [Candidatus Staskawiczbacteria bacterium RIFCSPLOWO2_01_FULL_37_25b]